MKVAPSIIAADFSQLSKELKKIEAGKADLLHLDVMDGVFVPNMTFGPMIVEAIDALTNLELDTHLMIMNPEKYLKQFIDAGSNWISLHAEATEQIDGCLAFVKERDIKVGLAISPPTPFDDVKKYIEELDYFLIMSVHPGFYGQKFMHESLRKIEETKNWIVKHKLNCMIQVDGGINRENVTLVKQAGADIVVAGAAVFKSSDYKRVIEDLRCSKG